MTSQLKRSQSSFKPTDIPEGGFSVNSNDITILVVETYLLVDEVKDLMQKLQK